MVKGSHGAFKGSMLVYVGKDQGKDREGLVWPFPAMWRGLISGFDVGAMLLVKGQRGVTEITEALGVVMAYTILGGVILKGLIVTTAITNVGLVVPTG